MAGFDVRKPLVGWVNLIHRRRGVGTINCHVADGTEGYPENSPYGRIVTWRTPARLPRL
ncbi:hypothetical protein ACH4OY_30160 [Micromonospora rubida]|uniref:Uncharacterized protein n=1 Tax=Micromonospora rubida TaxID=2697657 RepID=A0ABW7SW52_9ACTN